jgi:hypothetical protein
MDFANAAIRDGLVVSVHIVADIAAGHHRPRLVLLVSFLKLFTDFSLALCRFFRDISLHSKCSFLSGLFCFAKLIIH